LTETLKRITQTTSGNGEFNMGNPSNTVLESPLGKQEIDTTGSPVGIVRMEAEKATVGIGELLQRFINDSDASVWKQIKEKIDYMYDNLDLALAPLQEITGLKQTIELRLKKGQKLLFKPNTVFPLNITPRTHEPGGGNTACTEWSFVAALMRWFHDRFDISYHQMSLGEAATAMSPVANQYSLMKTGHHRIGFRGEIGRFLWWLGILFCQEISG